MSEEKRSELQLSEGPVCDEAKQIGPIQARMQQAESELATVKKTVSDAVVAIRDSAMANKKFLSIVRIANDTAPVRVEFRTGKAAAQNIVQTDDEGKVVVEDMEAYLKELLGGVYSQLFERRTIIASVNDGRKVYAALVNSGKDPWDFLQVSVRDGADLIVLDALTEHNAMDGVSLADQVLPVKDWLENLCAVAKALSEKALTYMKEFVKGGTSPVIVLSSKSKASK